MEAEVKPCVISRLVASGWSLSDQGKVTYHQQDCIVCFLFAISKSEYFMEISGIFEVRSAWC